MKSETSFFRIQGAKENNLQNLNLEIPRNCLIAVTGVSGSGKSSLAFDVIAAEGRRRYLETLPAFSRLFMGQLAHPAVEMIEGLSPVITLGQQGRSGNVRSTLGTLSDGFDLLRLLFARLGTPQLSRSHFSFNTAVGACPVCKGLGVTEQISLEKLITDERKSLREGVLAPTLPNGYIMYSQVTLEVLNQVCEAHGFSVEVPWNQLSAEQQKVILRGSTRLKVPFGKHSLESRLKWTGITAKPREEGYYKGILTIMTDILRRDRNKNILRYASSVTCKGCGGKRLASAALDVKLQGATIDQLADLPLTELREWLNHCSWTRSEQAIAGPITEKLLRIIDLLTQLGLGHLPFSRPAPQLSPSQSQRIRLVNQITAELSDLLYIFDEPSAGLHPDAHQQLMQILRQLVNNGNTVMVVEHDAATIRQADWIIDLGPGAGQFGGKLLFNGPREAFFADSSLKGKSPTFDALTRDKTEVEPERIPPDSWLNLNRVELAPLQGKSFQLGKGALNVVTGPAGAGKHQLMKALTLTVGDDFDRLVTLDTTPIGRTPRSNPATYTGLADLLRDLFAKQEAAQAAGFKKGRFSFNTKGGRCEACEGSGRRQIGMHFLGNVEVVCEVCEGKRFNAATLAVTYMGLSIAEVYALTVEAAIPIFSEEPGILRYLTTLQSVGLGYIQLGQPSTTLSGGEAQRVKIATQLALPQKGNTLYLLDHPTVGLHIADVGVLLAALRSLTEKGNTVVCIDHDPVFIRGCDWEVNLGGLPKEAVPPVISAPNRTIKQEIRLNGVTTHLLKNITVSFPKNQLTVITGVSGSGKSSLAFDTLFAEGQSRFTESLSTYARSLLRLSNPAKMESSSGLGPVVAVSRGVLNRTSRSTVGTVTGIYDHYRLLFSRIARESGQALSARHFSFNHQSGACPHCDGLGARLTCDPEKLITHPERTLAEGVMAGSRPGKYYGDPHGRFVALFQEAARQKGMKWELPWRELSDEVQELALYGTGDQEYAVVWEFKNKTRSGKQELTAPWKGFCNYVDEEYRLKHKNKNVDALRSLLHAVTCPACQGTRLHPAALAVQFLGKNIAEWSHMTVGQSLTFFQGVNTTGLSQAEKGIWNELMPRVREVLKVMDQLGLSYLSADRPAASLSGGEGQRIRLAGQFTANLFGVTYVLDEPTIGLHEKDSQALIGVIRNLIDRGNSAVVVEHDETMIRAADHLIEMGPGAGTEGGEVVVTGSLETLMAHSDSPTGRWLRGELQLPEKPLRQQESGPEFGVKGAFLHNLKDIEVKFASRAMIAVTGVSGSGKSTLVEEVLGVSLQRGRPTGCREVFGQEIFDQVIRVDQFPLGRNSLSTPATFSGLMDALRNWFAASGSAKTLGLKKGHFSYLHKDGKCPDCSGQGRQKTALDFMGEVWTSCETCAGLRYQPAVLACRINGKNVGEVLQMTVAEAYEYFAGEKKLMPFLEGMRAAGIGHLQLGQPAPTLSGGEAQRLKLARELVQPEKNVQNLYLLDEPSTGLHVRDLVQLLKLFRSLVEAGHTVLFIEHHPLMIRMADQVMELGPEGGPGGGWVIT